MGVRILATEHLLNLYGIAVGPMSAWRNSRTTDTLRKDSPEIECSDTLVFDPCI
jgi:hypothetical protein